MRSLMFLGFVVCSAFIDAKQYRYKTADLFQAVKIGHKRDVKQYLKSNIDVNALDIAGKTVLDYAAEAHNKKLVFMLVKKHAKVTTVQNLELVQQIIATKLKFLKAISYIFGGLAIVSLAWLTAGLYGSIFCGDLWALMLGVWPGVPTASVSCLCAGIVIRQNNKYQPVSIVEDNTLVVS